LTHPPATFIISEDNMRDVRVEVDILFLIFDFNKFTFENNLSTTTLDVGKLNICRANSEMVSNMRCPSSSRRVPIAVKNVSGFIIFLISSGIRLWSTALHSLSRCCGLVEILGKAVTRSLRDGIDTRSFIQKVLGDKNVAHLNLLVCKREPFFHFLASNDEKLFAGAEDIL